MRADEPRRIWNSADYDQGRYRCEYLVIGTGAGGGVAGALLAESGKDVLMLEEGQHHPAESFSAEIGEMTAKLYRNRGVFPFLGLPPVAFAEGVCVGGTTVINGGLLWRTPQWILDEWQNRHGLKGYAFPDLEKHFETIERDLNVVTPETDEDSNRDSQILHRAAEQLGWKSVPAPRGVKNCVHRNVCPAGCTSGAKQSILLTYIPRALDSGAKLFTQCRAVRIIHADGAAQKAVVTTTGENSKTFEIEFDHLVLCGGAIQTPHLLRRSKVSQRAGKNLEFHLNLKVTALFKGDIHADRGTIFTTQVQEFEREGCLFMASNLRPHYVAITMAHFDNTQVNHVLSNYEKSAIYVAQIRPRSRAHIFSGLGDNPLVWYRFHESDLKMAGTALRRLSELLFKGGAGELYFPVKGTGAIRGMQDAEKVLDQLRASDLQMASVHAMASCPMGISPKSSVVDPEGKLWDMKNVLLADASILPSNLGESPQETIMAFAHEVINRHINP